MDNEYGIKETVRDFFGAVLMFAFFVVITVLLFSM